MIVDPPVIVGVVVLFDVDRAILKQKIGGRRPPNRGPFPGGLDPCTPPSLLQVDPPSTGDNIASYESWFMQLCTVCAFGFADAAFGFGEGVTAELPELSDLIVFFGILSPSCDFPICASERSGSR